MEFKNKEDIKDWKKQLVVRPLIKSDKEEALNIFFRGYTHVNIVHLALEHNEQEFKSQEIKIFELGYIYENSIVLIDPSKNGKILMILVVRDLAHMDIKPPTKEEITCPKEFLKLQLYYDTWNPLENTKFVKGECETTSSCTDPDYQGLGLSIIVFTKYLEDAYLRGVKHFYDIYYILIAYNMGNKIKSFNSQILHKVNLNDYELNRKKIFENYSKDGGLLVRKDITDEVVKEVGLGHLIQKKKELQLNQQFKKINIKCTQLSQNQEISYES